DSGLDGRGSDPRCIPGSGQAFHGTWYLPKCRPGPESGNDLLSDVAVLLLGRAASPSEASWQTILRRRRDPRFLRGTGGDIRSIYRARGRNQDSSGGVAL